MTGLYRDTRGRVPFALVGVFLLVTSLALVGYVDTREPAEANTDPSLAMDRTDAAVQTAIRDATVRAAQRAGEEPLTTVAESPYGEQLDGKRPFRSYLEGLIYLETADRLGAVGHDRGAVRTNASLPAVSGPGDFGDAIDRVHVSDADAETGTLTVTIEGIDRRGKQGGEEFESRTDAVEVTVASPILQLHERTERFQSRLDAPVTQSGLAQRFNARIYAMGWARGYAQYAGAPITEVIANRHVEPAVNSAVYRTQQDVFGAADPQLPNAVRRGWFCMAVRDAESLYEGYSTTEVGVADDVCNASEWVLGDRHSGALPDPPGTLDLLGNAPGMDTEHTIGVNETAYLPLRTLVRSEEDHAIERAIDRIYTVETAIDTSVESDGPAFSHHPPVAGARRGRVERVQENVSVEPGRLDYPDEGEVFATFEGFEVSIAVTERQEWLWGGTNGEGKQWTEDTDTIEVAVSGELSEDELAPASAIRNRTEAGIETKYDAGPDTEESRTVPSPAGGFPNLAGAETAILEAVTGGTRKTAVAGWLESQWDNATRRENLTLPTNETVELDHHRLQDGSLERTIVDDLGALQDVVANITHTFERADLVHAGDSDGPVDELLSTVEREKAAFLDRDEAFVNVGQLAVYEARDSYFEQLAEDLGRVAEAQTEAMNSLDDGLAEVDSSIGDAVSFLQQGIAAEEPDPVPFQSPTLTPDVTYEVTGSPTYLGPENVTKDEVPAVDHESKFAPLAMQNQNYLKLPYQSIVDGFLNEVLDLIGLGDSDAELTFRTAGEALRAGSLAREATSEDGYADTQRLADLTGTLEDAIDDALGSFGQELARVTSEQLYLENGTTIASTIEPADHPAVPDDVPAEVTAATAETLAEFGSPAEMAIAIGEGNATDPLIDAIATRLAPAEFRPDYAENLTSEGWDEVVGSAVRPAIVTAAGDETVSLDDTDTVEALDTATRQALENVSVDIIADRLDEFAGDGEFHLGQYGDWVDGVDTPLRVPAGLPLLPIPTNWYATMNVWDVDAKGQYARFEVTAHLGTAGDGSSTAYVRENRSVRVDIAGQERTLGRVQPIQFDTRSVLVVVVPPGGVGVGDRDDTDPECSATYPVVGTVGDGQVGC